WVPTTGTGSVSWQFGSQDWPPDNVVNNTNSQLFVGQFYVETQDLSPNQVPTGTPTAYLNFSITDPNGHPVSTTQPEPFQLSFIPPRFQGAAVVPERSSAAIVVLIVGTAGFSGLIARRRRRRARAA